MKFIVEGGRRLAGLIKVRGSKNAAFPVIAASILAEGDCQIRNVPDIEDVRNFLHILKVLGAEFQFENHTLTINTRNLRNKDLSGDLVGLLRGSILLGGPMLSRFRQVRLAYPGGDAIGTRPIDVHLEGFKKLGAKVLDQGEFVDISADKLKGNKIVLRVTTVTGTENLILASVKTEGVTEILLADASPHVQDLCNFLNKMGAKIEGVSTPNLRIIGVSELRGTSFSIGPDEIEAVTFAIAAAATRGSVKISGVPIKHLHAPLDALERMNVNFKTDGDWIEIRQPQGRYKGTQITTGVYPQLLTDEQPLLGVLATQSEGETRIHDWIYEGRQGYLRALQEMGATVEFDDAHRARVYGPTELHGAQIKTPDIRAGASILIAALVAKGRSIIYNAEIIDRGYERIDERLNALGANIQRVEDD